MSESVNLGAVVDQLRTCRRRFTCALPRTSGLEVAGLYAFWVNGHCLYVGMSKNIGTRLYQHRMRQHNDSLALYMRAFWEHIEVAVASMPDTPESCLGRIEQKMIHALRPRTNIVRRKAS